MVCPLKRVAVGNGAIWAHLSMQHGTAEQRGNDVGCDYMCGCDVVCWMRQQWAALWV